MKVQHPQVQQDRSQALTEFIKEGEVNLKHGLMNCMESSSGRVTTALSVHGITVIQLASLVNDISSS
jgi:hypothetical protein